MKVLSIACLATVLLAGVATVVAIPVSGQQRVEKCVSSDRQGAVNNLRQIILSHPNRELAYVLSGWVRSGQVVLRATSEEPVTQFMTTDLMVSDGSLKPAVVVNPTFINCLQPHTPGPLDGLNKAMYVSGVYALLKAHHSGELPVTRLPAPDASDSDLRSFAGYVWRRESIALTARWDAATRMSIQLLMLELAIALTQYPSQERAVSETMCKALADDTPEQRVLTGKDRRIVKMIPVWRDLCSADRAVPIKTRPF